MPSYFRSDDDVRMFFLKELDTPEKKKKYTRLKTLFVQSVRRPGTRGHFFYHRRSLSLGGAPILIFEPQGPIDYGIFQGGITRFGETLFGTFRCTAPGYIQLEIKKNLSDPNRLKFARDIRKAIKSISGIMQTGGDDRVIIITPRQKALKAREAAEKKRREVEAIRERRHQLAEERRLKRELKRQKQEQQREKNEQLRKARKQKRKEAALSKQVAAEKARRQAKAAEEEPPRSKAEAARKLRREKEEKAAMARIERLQKEALAAEADGESVEADAAAEEARDLTAELIEHLRTAQEPHRAVARACKGKNKVQIQAALFQMIARSSNKAAAQRLLARVRPAAPDRLDATIAQWVSDEDARLSELHEAVNTAKAEALALEKLASRSGAAAMTAREEAAQLKLDELQARLTAAEAASDEEGASLEELREAISEAEKARREVQIAARQRDVSRALRAIQEGVNRMEEARDPALDNPKLLRRRMRQDPLMRKGLKRLRSAISALRASGAKRRALTEVWDEHPDILWAQATILSAL